MTEEHTWSDLEAAIGQDFSGGETRTAVDEVERGAIRKYCEPIEMDCPLHHDDEAARQHGYKGIIAPSSAIHQTFMSQPMWNPGQASRWPTADPDQVAARDPSETQSTAPPMPMPKTNGVLVTDMEIEYFEPVCVGDRLTSSGRKIISVNLAKTRVGYGAFTRTESEIHNQRGELVARVRNGSYNYNVGADS